MALPASACLLPLTREPLLSVVVGVPGVTCVIGEFEEDGKAEGILMEKGRPVLALSLYANGLVLLYMQVSQKVANVVKMMRKEGSRVQGILAMVEFGSVLRWIERVQMVSRPLRAKNGIGSIVNRLDSRSISQ